jgi:hypothetical protein
MPTGAGTYEFRLLNSGYVLLATSPTVTVQASAPVITVDATSVASGGSVTATLTGGSGGTGDWLALAAAGAPTTSYLQWIYVGASVTTRTWTVNMPTTPGTYVFRFFLNYGYGLAAASPSVSVGLPSAPNAASPANGVTSVTTTPTLTWASSGATSYDVKFGPTNPPAAMANNISTASYAPVVLSNNSTYYWQVVARNAAGGTTGPVWSFTTAAAASATTPAPPSSGAPLAYSAATDRNPAPKPPLPVLGPAGFKFVDPTFGSRMLRVTDGNIRPGALSRSYSTPSASHQNEWNTNSTLFYVRSTDGVYIPYAFDASTMTASRINPTSSGDGGLTIYSNTEPQFSYISPNIIYGAIQDATNDWPIIRRYDFVSGAFTNLLNLGSVTPIAQHTYVGSLSSSGGTPEKVAVLFGGPAQDAHFLVTVFAVGQSGALLLNTVASTTTINGVTTPTNITLNFHLHHAWLDKSGRYVVMDSTAPDREAPRYAAEKYVWDTVTNVFTEMRGITTLSGGHYSTGFGVMLNSDCCVTTAWDGAQFQLRSLATPTVSSDVISPILTPKEVYLDNHNSWNNAQDGSLVPIIMAFYRYGYNDAPWRAWDDELVAVQTNAGAAGATVWRFAHHRSDTRNDFDPYGLSFWYEPRPNVSQDGRWAVFTSNWEKTLGTDALGQYGGGYRQDVFLLELAPKP